MTFTNFEWKQDKEDDKGYYFVLTDTLHHLDYNVILIKDNGEIMVNGDYINNVPQYVAAAIAPRLDYFMAMNKCQKHNQAKRHSQVKHQAKKSDKKPEKKAEPKKTEKKKDEPKKPVKKDEPKKAEKKPEKKEDKKDEKKDKK